MEKLMDSTRKIIVLVDPVASGLPFLAAARKRELEILVIFTLPQVMVDRLGGERVRAIADHVFFASTSEEALNLVSLYIPRIVAVVPATEPSVDLAEELAMRLQLPSNGRIPGARRNKALMRETIHAAGLRSPAFCRCTTEEELVQFAVTQPGFLVVKTPQGAGTSQVYICRDHESLLEGFKQCLASADPFGFRPTYAVVEEYIGGEEVAVNLFVVDGHPWVIDIWSYSKIETTSGGPIYLSAIQRDSDAPELQAVIAYAVQVCKALGIETGVAHAEIKIDAQGPVLIEVGARLVGGRIGELWQRFSDFDPFEATISAFLGEVMPARSINFEKKLAVAYCPVWHAITRIAAIEGESDIEMLSSYVSHKIVARIGQPFGPTRDLESLAATVWLANTDSEQLARDMDVVTDLLRLVPTAELSSEVPPTSPAFF